MALVAVAALASNSDVDDCAEMELLIFEVRNDGLERLKRSCNVSPFSHWHCHYRFRKECLRVLDLNSLSLWRVVEDT